MIPFCSFREVQRPQLQQCSDIPKHCILGLMFSDRVLHDSIPRLSGTSESGALQCKALAYITSVGVPNLVAWPGKFRVRCHVTVQLMPSQAFISRFFTTNTVPFSSTSTPSPPDLQFFYNLVGLPEDDALRNSTNHAISGVTRAPGNVKLAHAGGWLTPVHVSVHSDLSLSRHFSHLPIPHNTHL